MRYAAVSIVVVVAAIFAVLVFGASPGDGLAPASGSPRAPDAPGEEAASRSATTSPPNQTAKADAPVAVESTERNPIERDDRATFRGRCVDEGGAALAGVTVRLRGYAGSEQLDRYRMEHGDASPWTEPAPAQSDREGRFEFRVMPAPPRRLGLEFSAEQRVPCEVWWRTVEPGAMHDVGDVVMPMGVVVRGRLVDDDGAAVSGANLQLAGGVNAPRQVDGLIAFARSGSARSDSRGDFALHAPLSPGSYQVAVWAHTLREPTAPIMLSPPLAELRVVVAKAEPNATPTITGVVVDEGGMPIPSADILVGDSDFGAGQSRRDGTFELTRRDDMPRTGILIGAGATGYATSRLSDAVEWGARDLRLVLQEGPSMTVRVRRAADDSPIERFGIQLLPIRKQGGASSDDDRLWFAGVHQDGVLHIERATVGRYYLVVVPAESTGLPASTEREIAIEVGVPQTFDFRLEPLAERVVEVVDRQGKPLEGARLEHLLHRAGGKVYPLTPAMDERNARMNSRDGVALLCADVRTDARGRVTLRGHRSLEYALRLPGPGHVPRIVQPFRFADESIERVVVGSGATLRGRIEPASLLSSLREEAGLPVDGEVDADSQAYLPALQLTGSGDREGEVFPAGGMNGGAAPVAADGSFELSGVPPGVWDVCVRSSQKSAMSLSTQSRCALQGVAIADGETRELVLRLDSWVRRKVTFEFRVDGRAWAMDLRLSGRVGLRPDGQPDRVWRSVKMDENGRVEVGLPAGEWDTSVWFVVDRQPCELPGPSFVIGPSQALPLVTADLRSARREVLLVDPDGVPLTEVAVAFGAQQRRSDSAGKLVLLGAPGQYRLRIRREPLLPDRAYSAWISARRDDDDARLRAWLDLGTVDLLPDGGDLLTVRLPQEWRQMPK
jgi:protocatechuate 3,4-dioxygenase beta subunit